MKNLTTIAGVLISVAQMAHADVAIDRDDENGRLTIRIDGSEALVYQYANSLEVPHFWPVRSPSGKELTVQHPPADRFPHHRSLWIADNVELAGQKSVDFYHSSKNRTDKGNRIDKGDASSDFRHGIRHVAFSSEKVENGIAEVVMNAIWEIDGKTPVLDQVTTATIHSLDRGEYLVDLAFLLTASYGDVKFNSDWVHYAWPYFRMHPQFSGEQGGRITDDQGRTTQKETNGRYAKWIDYSNSIDGTAEGLTVFSHPSNGRNKWLTREYGTFGPRRSDDFSGTKFTLKQGKSIGGRVGILVHRGDVTTGRVSARFQRYMEVAKPAQP